MNNDRFTSDQRMGGFRRLACSAITGAERQRWLGLLAEEEDRHIDLRSARTAGFIDLANPWQPDTSRTYSTNQMVS